MLSHYGLITLALIPMFFIYGNLAQEASLDRHFVTDLMMRVPTYLGIVSVVAFVAFHIESKSIGLLIVQVTIVSVCFYDLLQLRKTVARVRARAESEN